MTSEEKFVANICKSYDDSLFLKFGIKTITTQDGDTFTTKTTSGETFTKEQEEFVLAFNEGIKAGVHFTGLFAVEVRGDAMKNKYTLWSHPMDNGVCYVIANTKELAIKMFESEEIEVDPKQVRNSNGDILLAYDSANIMLSSYEGHSL